MDILVHHLHGEGLSGQNTGSFSGKDSVRIHEYVFCDGGMACGDEAVLPEKVIGEDFAGGVKMLCPFLTV